MKKQRSYTVGDITKLCGITRRTLYYYDEIGFLKPSSFSSKGHRLYDQGCIEKLHMILFLKEMDLPLKDIAKTLQLPKQEQKSILKSCYPILSRKKQRIENAMSKLRRYLSGEDIFHLFQQ